MKKYENLEAKLRRGADLQSYTFDELEEIMGAPISPDYLNRKTIQHKSKSCFCKYAELAGFVVFDVDYEGREITFARPSAIPSAPSRKGKTKKSRLPFVERTVTDSEALELLLFVCQQWDGYLTALGSLGNGGGKGDYLQDTDRMLLDPSTTLLPSQYLYKQLAMHAQNSRIAGRIRFLKGNEPLIASLTGNYGLNPRSDIFALPSLPGTLAALSSALSSQTPAISMNEDWTLYAKTMRSISAYVYPPSHISRSAADVYRDCFVSPRPDHLEIKTVLEKFIGLIPNGFKDALTFDFLKSCDPRFDYPKPDLHVRRVMYYFKNANPPVPVDMDCSLSPFVTMSRFMDWIEAAKREYTAKGGTHPGSISAYKIDRMIYQICADEPLFLPVDVRHNPSRSRARSNKRSFIESLARRSYRLSRGLTPADIAYIDTILS